MRTTYNAIVLLHGKPLITSSRLILQEKNKSSCYNTAIVERQVPLIIVIDT